ncbi:hypothetical protein PIROE2DRAFT_12997 [Piromyces sp. E2]|nr:hypothetical protein PIROE2DRAFT_12997 [Piromyces sp. E2]|eukprot:OUM61084.1 hypothetical protein PIROE2DRAFT_12997 [Piromyces sp. E2]
MKKETYILENSYTIPINSEVLFEYYSNIDYIITSETLHICTSTRKGINITSIGLPFNSKSIQERCKNEIKVVDSIARYKIITIFCDDLLENQSSNISEENINFNGKSNSFEKKYINKNYLLIFGKTISLFDLKNLEFLYQCQPLISNSQCNN